MSECLVHDGWKLEKPCTCNAERKWARQKMIQECLEKIAKSAASPSKTAFIGKEK